MTRSISCLLFFSLLFSLYSSAQTPDEKQVADRVETLRKAMISADKAALGDLTAEELSYGHSSGKVEDKAAFIEELVKGRSVFTTITLSDQTIKVAGNTAIVRHHLVADTNNNNVPGKADIFILLVWQKQNGQWKLLARQAVKKPA
jgi:ketosteroid isomerase-like protein